jgi:hypothetical protein
MKDVYVVQTWNGKDGYLTNDKGELIALSKSELTPEFGGRLVVGEKIEFKTTAHLVDRLGTEDERERRAFLSPKPVMSARASELMNKEIDRRTRYGSGPGVMGR